MVSLQMPTPSHTRQRSQTTRPMQKRHPKPGSPHKARVPATPAGDGAPPAGAPSGHRGESSLGRSTLNARQRRHRFTASSAPQPRCAANSTTSEPPEPRQSTPTTQACITPMNTARPSSRVRSPSAPQATQNAAHFRSLPPPLYAPLPPKRPQAGSRTSTHRQTRRREKTPTQDQRGSIHRTTKTATGSHTLRVQAGEGECQREQRSQTKI